MYLKLAPALSKRQDTLARALHTRYLDGAANPLRLRQLLRNNMTRIRSLLLAGAAFVFGITPACPQSSVRMNLPAGLFQKGNAVMMARYWNDHSGTAPANSYCYQI